MDCPVCGERLKEVERSGVLVDICPSCKGVWLDRGEIDKIMATERQGGQVVPIAQARDDRNVQRRDSRGHDDHDHDDHDEHGDDHKHRDTDRAYQYGSSGQRRKSSFLSDILGGFGGD
jgi:Zn-finger nucleic acid-binding protein